MARKILYKKGGKPKKVGKKKQMGGQGGQGLQGIERITGTEETPVVGRFASGRLMPPPPKSKAHIRTPDAPPVPTPPVRTAPGYGDMTYAEKLGLTLGLKTKKTTDVYAKRRADAAAREAFFQEQGMTDLMKRLEAPPQGLRPFKKGGKKKKKALLLAKATAGRPSVVGYKKGGKKKRSVKMYESGGFLSPPSSVNIDDLK